MAQAPVMPLFTDALIADTTHLNTKQFGAYVLILIATWRNNGRAFADDDKQLAQLCRMRVDIWRRYYRPTIVQFFDISDGFWHQKRLEKEWRKRRQYVAKMAPLFESRGEPIVVSRLDSVLAKNNGLDGGNPTRARARPSHKYKNPSSSLPASARAPGLSVGPDHARDAVTPRSLGSILDLAKESPPPPSAVEQRQQHARFLMARGTRDDVELYYAAQLSDDPSDGQRMFELTAARMRAEGWEC